MSKLYWLSDREWARIEPLLPRGRKGAHRVDDRRVIVEVGRNCSSPISALSLQPSWCHPA